MDTKPLFLCLKNVKIFEVLLSKKGFWPGLNQKTKTPSLFIKKTFWGV